MEEKFRRLVKFFIPKRLFKLIEPWGHTGEMMLAQLLGGFPARKLKIIGVTGTDGKTTTSTLIHSMLKAAGFKVGLVTTVSVDVGDGLRPNPTRMTAIQAFPLVKILKQARAHQLDWIIIETTSHALAQGRLWGIRYSLAVMTNVTHEHLDYHGSFERYRDAKLRLFKRVAQNPHSSGVGVVNAEDPSADLFAGVVPKPLTYGISKGELRGSNITAEAGGSGFTASYRDRTLNLWLNLPGSFNVLNALAAIGVGIALKLSDKQIEDGIVGVKSVEGRMNTVDLGQDFTLIVDYAHTPESFEKVFAEIKPVTKGRLIVVFGSAGERDHAKRPMQGEVAGKWCDIVVITEEDDRTEDGLVIMDEIAAGAKKAGKKLDQDLFLVHDRSKAIKKAVDLAKKDDTILLLGKGHESNILHGKEKRPWDEMAEAARAIKRGPGE